MPRKKHKPEQVMKEVQVLTEAHRQTYNHNGPHCSLGDNPLVPQAVLAADTVPALVGLT